VSTDDATHTFGAPGAPGQPGVLGAAPGAEIGPYKIVRQLGEGGMGAVYLASQQQPIRRDVALKIIKPGMDSRQVISRFESERQTLALMDHANIARVFDAGATSTGLPFFVMELVDGVPITRYCDSKRLTVKERIALFIPVCRAIQHAHQKGVIHRDLKPSNILVAEQEGKPVPKVIDFGLAKALAWQESDATMLTNAGTVVGTLDYMSPEQADPVRNDVDTRGDVYSLGAVLYELLTGSTPLDRERMHRAGYVEILKQIRDGDTPPPSTRLRRSASSADIAGRRQTDPARLTRMLNGDLDWVLMKALDKDRTRRYETVNGMARDLERYLAGEAVEAAPPSAAYRMRKFVRRHVVALSFAASVLALLIAFAVAVTIDARRITRERDRANRITQFMVGIFQKADSTHSRGNKITAREILDNSAREISLSLRGDPQAQADLLGTMARSYDGLGLYARARDLLAEVIDIQRRTLGPRDRATLASMSLRGSTMVSNGDPNDAVQWLRETLAIQKKALGPDDIDTLLTQSFLSDALLEESDAIASERLARETLEVQRRTLGSGHKDTLHTMRRLAAAQEVEGHYADADKLLREVVSTERRLFGADDPDFLHDTSLLAKLLTEEGRYPEAEVLFAEALSGQRRVLGPEHGITLDTLADSAYVDLKQGNYAAAEKLYREAVEIKTRIYGADDSNVLADREELAITYTREGRYAEASEIFKQVIGAAEKSQNQIVNVAWYNFACAAAIAGHPDEAYRYLRQAVDSGFVYADLIAEDKDTASLHSDPRFAAILEEARRRAAQKK